GDKDIAAGVPQTGDCIGAKIERASVKTIGASARSCASRMRPDSRENVHETGRRRNPGTTQPSVRAVAPKLQRAGERFDQTAGKIDELKVVDLRRACAPAFAKRAAVGPHGGQAAKGIVEDVVAGDFPEA